MTYQPDDIYYNAQSFKPGCAMDPLRVSETDAMIRCRMCGQMIARSHGSMMTHMIAHLRLNKESHGVHESIRLGEVNETCTVCGENILAIAQAGCSCCDQERNMGYWWMLHLMLNPDHYPILLLMGATE
jgi:ribosomal protein L37E